MTRKLINAAVNLVHADHGTAVTEYAIMLSLIVLASIGGLIALGDKVALVFTSLQEALPGA